MIEYIQSHQTGIFGEHLTALSSRSSAVHEHIDSNAIEAQGTAWPNAFPNNFILITADFAKGY